MVTDKLLRLDGEGYVCRMIEFSSPNREAGP
jgi:hypothetical protein